MMAGPGDRRMPILIVWCRDQLRDHDEAAHGTETVEESPEGDVSRQGVDVSVTAADDVRN